MRGELGGELRHGTVLRADKGADFHGELMGLLHGHAVEDGSGE